MRSAWFISATVALGCAGGTVAQAQVAVPVPVRKSVVTSPVRMAVTADGLLLVSDYDQQAVFTLDPGTRKIISVLPVGGRVTGVAASGERVFVGNETTGGIEIYDANSGFSGFLGGDQQFVLNPTDLTIDESADLLFALDGEDRNIKVFSLAGEGALVQTIAGPGMEEHLLQHPTGIAIDAAAQEIYVTDYGEIDQGVDPRVLIFGYDGVYRQSVSGNDGAQGFFFSKPQGIAIGETGHIFVADAWLGRVAVMDRATGEEVGRLGQFGQKRGQLRMPLDLLIFGPDRDLFVTSNLTGRVEVFHKGGQM